MYENEKDDGKYFVNSNNFSDDVYDGSCGIFYHES